MPGSGARGKNLGHLSFFGSKFWLKFLCWCISHEPIFRNHSYLDYAYHIRFAFFFSMSSVHARGVGLEFKI